MRGKNQTPVRTVIVPYTPEGPLLRALSDIRAAANELIRDWRAHPDESRFEATRRSYRELRPRYAHLASHWSLAACNEASATLRSWDKMLRRARRHDPEKFEKLRKILPHRKLLKASLPRELYRLHGKVLDIAIRPDHHLRIDLSETRNPLFWRYRTESQGEFGLAVTDRKLVFNFRVPRDQPVVAESAGVDLNMPSADFATSDGIVDSVDLTEITRIQGAMARKREKVQRAIPTDRKAQHRVVGRYRNRERNRVTPLLHRAANELLTKLGDRNIIFEDLTETTEELLKERRQWRGRKNPEVARRSLSAWTHGRLQRIVGYKSNTAVLRVDPRGTSSECPQCGGVLHHPSWRRSDCANCQGSWHRDRAAAIVILSRGLGVLRGAAPPPRARNALREAAAWRPGVDDESRSGPTTPPMNGDDAKDFGLMSHQ
ncbi:MAG: zinc ribbon domain-containing protein [Thermoplasmata archaeon]|nr:zinc ribbon domain-containing protein [Thermoplasmata archaeon]